MSPATTRARAPTAPGMRMAELARRSGVSRETIHFYLREGLLPRPRKGGKTVAFYDEQHLRRLGLIRRLREEKYLPLAVIGRLFRAGVERAEDQDLDALADVIHIDPTVGRLARLGPHEPGNEPLPVGDDVVAEALKRGLLGSSVVAVDRFDPTERRVLASVEEACRLDPSARLLTLDDMQACSPMLSELVTKEAALFFEWVAMNGDMRGAIEALRAGRGAIARYVTAFRDLMLRRIVDETLAMMNGRSEWVAEIADLSLGKERLLRLEVATRRKELERQARKGDTAAAEELVWQFFTVGPARSIGRLSSTVRSMLSPRARALVAWMRFQLAPAEGAADLEGAIAAAAPFPLGEVLGAEMSLLRLTARARERGGFLDQVAAALHRLTLADPGMDSDALAASSALYRRGRIELVLPAVLGRHPRGLFDLASAIRVASASPSRVGPAARARLEGNARLAMGRHRVAAGAAREGRLDLERALAIDPAGPIGRAARRALGRIEKR